MVDVEEIFQRIRAEQETLKQQEEKAKTQRDQRYVEMATRYHQGHKQEFYTLYRTCYEKVCDDCDCISIPKSYFRCKLLANIPKLPNYTGDQLILFFKTIGFCVHQESVLKKSSRFCTKGYKLYLVLRVPKSD